GVRRFFILAPAGRRSEVECSLGSFRSRSDVSVVDRFEPSVDGIDPESPCISFAGNLVFSKRQLKRVLDNAAQSPTRVFRFLSSDADHGGEIAVGPMRRLLEQDGLGNEPLRRSTGELPFALNGRPEDRDEAELRLARSLRQETAGTDAVLARLLDRRLSWRIS